MDKRFSSWVRLFSRSWILLGQAILVIVIMEGISFTIWSLKIDSSAALSILEPGAPTPDSYQQADWYKDYLAEFTEVIAQIGWQPYVYWKTLPFHGKYINVDDDSRRKSWRSPQPLVSAETIKIFIFGGSTIWGWGVRDDHTIPSYVKKILWEEHHLDCDVINMGEIGFVSTQEVIYLMTELQRHHHPHIVIFYDGLNEVCSTLRTGQLGKVGIPWDELEREESFERERRSLVKQTIDGYARHSPLYQLFSPVLKRPLLAKSDDAELHSKDLAEEIVSLYRQNMDVVRALSQFFGFDMLCYWQPTILSKEDVMPYEQKLVEEGENYLHGRSLFSQVQEKVSLLKDEGFRDLSQALTGYESSFYIDYFHIDEKGNEIIGREIVKDLLPLIKDS